MTTYVPSITLPGYLFDQPALSILLPVGCGLAVGLLAQPNRTQKLYLDIKQPPLRPPPQVFAPVWTLLYGAMGYAAHRAWTTGMASMNPHTMELAKHGATLYTVQLGLNLVWMPLFFVYQRPIEATIDIIALTGVTSYLYYVWSQVDEVAAYAIAPYLGWLGFATYLCAGAGYLNNWDFAGKKVEKQN